jgi:hypothetical protein
VYVNCYTENMTWGNTKLSEIEDKFYAEAG